MKKYILVALFALVGNPSFADKCTPQSRCFKFMTEYINAKGARDPEPITSAQDYAKGINAGRQCIGKGVKDEQALADKYTNILLNPKSKWNHIISKKRENDTKDPIIKCLRKLRLCETDRPCLDKMKNIPVSINSGDDYAKGINAARNCIGKDEKPKELLAKKYVEKLSAYKTWDDIIKLKILKNAKDPVVKCLEVIKVCSRDNPCLLKMSKVRAHIKNSKDYEIGINAAFDCIGEAKKPTSAELEKGYMALPGKKSTWKDISKIREKDDPKDPIIKCLNAIPEDCSDNDPCFYTMDQIPSQIKSPKDYAIGINAAFDCIGQEKRPTSAELEKEYEQLKGPKDTWVQVIETREKDDPKDPIIKCLKKIEVCSAEKPCLDIMKKINAQIKDEKEYEVMLNAAFDCIGQKKPKDKNLTEEYNQLKDPKGTSAEVASQMSEKDPTKKCLEAIPKT